MAVAQIAHVATVAANKWKITHETYIIILASQQDEDFKWFQIDTAWGNDYVTFEEPDLDYRTTAIASLNPDPSFYKHLKLWKGGE